MNAFLVSGIAILMLGLMIIKLSFKQYRLRSFIGIEVEGNEFIRSGILECVRHPLYTATILIIVAFFLILPTKSILLVNLLTFIYLVIGIFLEERKLTIQYGAKYLRYKEEVPSIIPKFKCLSFQKTSKN
jgi:protein-S-isoprenylcysteine O-methyltransferase Ste14